MSQAYPEIADCPFCGGDASFGRPRLQDNDRYWELSVSCDICSGSITVTDDRYCFDEIKLRELASAAWNRRPEATAVSIADKVAQLRKEAEAISDPQLRSVALSIIGEMENSLRQDWPSGFPKPDSRVGTTFSSAISQVEGLIVVDF